LPPFPLRVGLPAFALAPSPPSAIAGALELGDYHRFIEFRYRAARTLLSARENAQRCAADCAPYVHAKLQAVHHEHGPTGRYIISDRPMTEAEWIKERATVIDVTPEKIDG
jgi:hypothetical protein